MITSVVILLVTAACLIAAFQLRKPPKEDPVRTTREAAAGRAALARVLTRVVHPTSRRFG